jgi:hypothetical protein
MNNDSQIKPSNRLIALMYEVKTNGISKDPKVSVQNALIDIYKTFIAPDDKLYHCLSAYLEAIRIPELELPNRKINYMGDSEDILVPLLGLLRAPMDDYLMMKQGFRPALNDTITYEDLINTQIRYCLSHIRLCNISKCESYNEFKRNKEAI